MSRVETIGSLMGGAAPRVRPEELKAIRYRLKQSQSEFALMLGISLATLQGWESGRNRPDSKAVALLRKTLGRG